MCHTQGWPASWPTPCIGWPGRVVPCRMQAAELAHAHVHKLTKPHSQVAELASAQAGQAQSLISSTCFRSFTHSLLLACPHADLLVFQSQLNEVHQPSMCRHFYRILRTVNSVQLDATLGIHVHPNLVDTKLYWIARYQGETRHFVYSRFFRTLSQIKIDISCLSYERSQSCLIDWSKTRPFLYYKSPK